MRKHFKFMLLSNYLFGCGSVRRVHFIQLRFLSDSSRFSTGTRSSIFSATVYNVSWRAALLLTLLAFLILGLTSALLVFACTASTFEAFDDETVGEYFSYKTPCLDSNIYLCEGLLWTSRVRDGVRSFRNRFHV